MSGNAKILVGRRSAAGFAWRFARDLVGRRCGEAPRDSAACVEQMKRGPQPSAAPFCGARTVTNGQNYNQREP